MTQKLPTKDEAKRAAETLRKLNGTGPHIIKDRALAIAVLKAYAAGELVARPEPRCPSCGQTEEQGHRYARCVDSDGWGTR